VTTLWKTAPETSWIVVPLRDFETKQPKKGNQWDVGVKAHIGVDAASWVPS